MAKNRKAEKPNILAVEGKDECNFFTALIEHMHLANIQIEDMGGKEKFRSEFPLLAQSEKFYDIVKNIGFVRDAEEKEATAAFQSICGILNAYKLPVPQEPNALIGQDGRKVAIFIMPNNKDSGMLEDLCIESRKADPVWYCVEAFVKCYNPLIEKDKYNISKAKMAAFLSTRVPIVNSLGIAAQDHVWDFDNPCFNSVKDFLTNLFG
ncbi:MAG: hypothetical protein LBQ46_04255 [Treponema sp.]|jgi:hypothetical protein|nr:hypothetical protein [Treponema sp.]